MRRTAWLFLILLILFAGSIPARAGEYIPSDRPLPGRYLLVLEPGAVRAPNAPPTAPGRTVAQNMSELALAHGVVAERVFEHALQGGVIVATEGRARALARDPRVAWVEEDGEVEAFATRLAVAQWWLDRSDERNRPLNNHFTYDKTGTGVNIYVIDTGVNFNLGLWTGRAFNAYSNALDASGNPVFGDPVGHGTNVALHAAATGWGVATGANVRAVRVRSFTCGTSGGGNPEYPAYAGTCFSISDLAAAINWVAGNRITPAVANMSFGGGISTSLETAVQGMLNSNVTSVAAAGNSNASACSVSPARMSSTTPLITLGASTMTDARASFSNFGTCVTLFAPGQDVYSGVDGTSFSSPLAAGAAALYLQGAPSATPSTVKTWLINNATTGRLTGIGTGSPNRLLYIPPGGTEVDNPPVANFNFSCSGRTCTFTSTSTDDFGSVGCFWNWNHNYDWQPDQGCALSHTFPAAGSYSVTLHINDDAWQQASKVRVVTVN